MTTRERILTLASLALLGLALGVLMAEAGLAPW